MAKMKHDDAKMDKKMAQKAINKHESKMHPGKPKTKLAKGGGVKIRGTGAATKGTMARGPMA
jgi:hypothetical protein